jgi:drug/metabolite transporter (DMT)-like permease
MPLALPLLASLLYAVGSWGLKLGLRRGARPGIVTALSNLSMAGWSAPLIFFFPGQPNASGFWGAILAGTALFLGRTCAIRALSHGDLSHATPLLGTKTIFVAALTSFFLDEPITTGLMAGAILTSLAVTLLSITPTPLAKSWWPGKFDRATTLWALLAAFFFALTDIVVQKFARLLGVGWFQPLMFSTLALLTPLLFLPKLPRPNSLHALLPPPSRASTMAGSAVIGFQTSLVILVIGIFGHATATNVVYAARGLWAVLLEGAAGGGAASNDRRILILRLTGAALLLAAVALAVGSL